MTLARLDLLMREHARVNSPREEPERLSSPLELLQLAAMRRRG